MPISAKVLAYLGLIPFIGIPILIFSELLSAYSGYVYFVQYSAIILSFFGGIHWYDALQKKRTNHQLYVSMAPSIVAWGALIFLEGSMLLSVLSIAYIAILMYDKYNLELERQVVIEYTFLRIVLTTLVVLCHFLMVLI
ncbi:DUF3429 domain-containing protein [Agaribacter flavus]|uniref:DUF3429 domain-containing protein n=1 Tax=Agaribacter flavus TaxID=1902781 RepID=A0ABV7FK13_9ALTE